MPTVLKNVLRFTALGIGVSTFAAHGLNFNARSLAPKNVWLNGAGYNVTADATNVAIERLSNGGASVDVAVELWHSYEDAEPMPGGISVGFLPFIMQGGGGSGGGTETPFGLSAGTQSVSTGTVSFANSNGLTFGMSGSSRITGSFSTVVFSNSNNVSFGLNGSTITASASSPAETPFAFSAGSQSVSTGTVVFASSNGVSFGMSGSSQLTGRVISMIGTDGENLQILATGTSPGGQIILSADGLGANIRMSASLGDIRAEAVTIALNAAQQLNINAGSGTLSVSGRFLTLLIDQSISAFAPGVASFNFGEVHSTMGIATMVATQLNLSVSSLRFFDTINGGTNRVLITGASTDATLVLNNLLLAMDSLGLISKSTT